MESQKSENFNKNEKEFCYNENCPQVEILQNNFSPINASIPAAEEEYRRASLVQRAKDVLYVKSVKCLNNCKFFVYKFVILKEKGSKILDSAFARHGELVYDHAWKYIIGFTLLSSLMSVGLLYKQSEFDMYKLYSYSGAPSIGIQERLEQMFTKERQNHVFVRGDENLLQPETLKYLKILRDKIINLKIKRDEVLTDEFGNVLSLDQSSTRTLIPEVLNYGDLCSRDASSDCSIPSVLELYTSERQWGRKIVSRPWPIVLNSSTKKIYRVDALLGNIKVEHLQQGTNKLGIVSDATACVMRFDLLGKKELLPYSAALERKMESVISNYKIPNFTIDYRMERSISDELQKSSVMGPAEGIALTLAIITVLLYATIVNTTFSYRTKTIPGVICVFSTLLGYAGGAGFVYMCGVLHTPPAEATPFLVLGIGVDNAFVLLNSYCLTFLIPTPKGRVINASRDAGVSITITSMTSVSALIIGAVSPYLSISRFCMVTAFSLCWSYVLSQTIFLGFLALDARREYRQGAKRNKKQQDQSSDALARDNLPKTLGSTSESFPQNNFREGSNNNHPLMQEHFDGEKADDDLQSILIEENAATPISNSNIESTPNRKSGKIEIKNFKEITAAESVEVHRHDNARPCCNGNSHDGDKNVLLIEAVSNLSIIHLASLITFRMQRTWQVEANKMKTLVFNNIERAEATIRHRKLRKEENRMLPDNDKATNNNLVDRKHSLEKGCVSPFTYRGVRADEGLANLAENSSESQTRFVKMRVSSKSSDINNSESVYIIMNENKFLAFLDAHIREPKGNVGRIYRYLFIKYYCRLISHKWIRWLIIISFTAIIALALTLMQDLKMGISADEITPNDSYLRTFFETRGKYFSSLGDEVTVFFQQKSKWESKHVQEKLIEVHEFISSSGRSVAAYNGMYEFLSQQSNLLTDNDKDQFNQLLYDWLQTDLMGRQFRNDFIFRNSLNDDGAASEGDDINTNKKPVLTVWKFHLWLHHSLETDVLLKWLTDIRDKLREGSSYFVAEAYTPLAVLWESDRNIVNCTVKSLLAALVMIIIMTALLIPNFLSVLIVGICVLLVDICLFGFMAIWGLHLNLLTMVILLLAIGYSVDSTIFMLNAFTHGCGNTREARMTEGVLLMGSPVANGMLSTLLAVLFLVGSTKFVLIAFYRMMILVLVISGAFGFVLLPAVLCIVGPLPKNDTVISYIDTTGNSNTMLDANFIVED